MLQILLLTLSWYAAGAQWQPLTSTADCASHLSVDILIEAEDGTFRVGATAERFVFKPSATFQPESADQAQRALEGLAVNGVPLVYYPSAYRGTRFEQELLQHLLRVTRQRHRAQPFLVMARGTIIFDYSLEH